MHVTDRDNARGGGACIYVEQEEENKEEEEEKGQNKTNNSLQTVKAMHRHTSDYMCVCARARVCV